MNGVVRQYFATEITEATEKMLGLARIGVTFACFVDPQLVLRVPSVPSVISVVDSLCRLPPAASLYSRKPDSLALAVHVWQSSFR
jgi:hypothetical protein